MVIMYREKKIVLPRFIASPILLGTSLVTRFKNKSTLRRVLSGDRICVELGPAGSSSQAGSVSIWLGRISTST